MRLIAIDAVA